MEKRPYEAPVIEVFRLHEQLQLLVTFSATIPEDIPEGEEIFAPWTDADRETYQ